MGFCSLKIDGVVIKEVSLNEKDKLLTILTAEKGKMIFLARGIKSLNSRRSAGSNLFSYSTFTFYEKDGNLKPDEIILQEGFFRLAEDVKDVALASYFAEILNHICMEEAEEKNFLRLMLNSLFALANTDTPHWMVKAAFEMQAMKFSGVMPDFDNCLCCHTPLGEPEDTVILDSLQGGFVCDKCSNKDSFSLGDGCVPVMSDAFLAMRYVSYSGMKKMLQFKLPERFVKNFSDACEQYISSQTERKFPTLDYYKKL